MVWGQPSYLSFLFVPMVWFLLRWWMDGRQKRVVASTIVWKMLLKEPIGKAVANRKVPPSVLLECLLLILVAVALGDPQFAQRSGARETVVLVDRGFAMGAPSRQQAVRELLKAWPTAQVIGVGEGRDTAFLDWADEVARHAMSGTHLVLVGDRFAAVPPALEVHVVMNPIRNRGITAAALSGESLFIGVTASSSVESRESMLVIEGEGVRVLRRITLLPGKQVGVLIPRTEVVSDVTSILSIKLEGVDAIAADNSAIIAVKQVSRSVGVEPGLQAVRDALVASGRRVVGVGADHDGGGLALVAGRWHEGLGARRLVFPADGGPFGAVAPDGKWSATGVLGDLPLTVNESTNAVQVSADFEGSMVLLSRGGQPIIVGDPEARLVYAGIDPDDPDWAKSELFCLAVDRMADWLAAGDTALSVPEFLSVEEVRGDATPEASRTTVARGEREPRRRALYPWFLLSALAVLLGLAFMGKSRAGR